MSREKVFELAYGERGVVRIISFQGNLPTVTIA